jgi:hypothetical protein
MKYIAPGLGGTLEAVAISLVNGDKAPEEARMRWFLTELDALLKAAGIKTQLAFSVALLTVLFSPPFLIGKLRLYTGLSRADQVHVLEKYEMGPLSILFAAIKTLICMVYFEHPRTLVEAGLDPRRVWPGVEEEMGDELKALGLVPERQEDRR